MTQLVKRDRCPKCYKLGKDRKGDNLAIYADGHSWCYSCGYRHFPPLALLRSRLDLPPKPSTTVILTTSLQPHMPNATSPKDPRPRRIDLSDTDLFSRRLPSVANDWLHKYGITEDEAHANDFRWDARRELLIMPVYHGEQCISYQGRYFGSGKYPKYHTQTEAAGFFKLFPQLSTSVYVLVEDYLSAIKVGRFYNAIPLFGSLVPRVLILALLSKRPVLRLWLDNDKAKESVGFANSARQYIEDVGTIITELDPKEYSNEAILDTVGATLKPQLTEAYSTACTNILRSSKHSSIALSS